MVSIEMVCLFEGFWENFWPNFYSNIVSGIILTYVITLVIQRLNNPKLDIVLEISTGTQNHRILNFYCINTGKTGLMPNEMQWHLYFDTAFEFLNISEVDWIGFYYKGREHYQLRGTNGLPCLPGSSSLLASFNVKLNTDTFPYDQIDDAPFYYSLTTIKGEKGKGYIFKTGEEKEFIHTPLTTSKKVFRITTINI
ncbi:hypothetical protein DYBT9623_05475 [Dyadobacter sp. CECT 9623]|uniref:SMODS-associating 2TM beta-strand rich effector domain-containing protein n=1 Tax=Dyadobacter linearis TaxID=2823330 RepID=A0ABN7RF78_9BACT|nr:hypothetical protein [Dyadobacter sp. CECT 9623]CAG5074787.1 hypothetical protein DYBT9623_05475 [Dyadobacter sp. CECT 9623]